MCSSDLGRVADGLRGAFGGLSFDLATVNDEATFSGRLSVVALLFEASARKATETPAVGGVMSPRRRRGKGALACIGEFAKKGGAAKNVVCGNDAVAVLLRSYFPELLENRRICSCSGMKISEFTNRPYPKTTVNYFKAGVRLAELYLFLIKIGRASCRERV